MCHRRITPPPRTHVITRPSRLRLPIHGFPPYSRASPALPTPLLLCPRLSCSATRPCYHRPTPIHLPRARCLVLPAFACVLQPLSRLTTTSPLRRPACTSTPAGSGKGEGEDASRPCTPPTRCAQASSSSLPCPARIRVQGQHARNSGIQCLCTKPDSAEASKTTQCPAATAAYKSPAGSLIPRKLVLHLLTLNLQTRTPVRRVVPRTNNIGDTREQVDGT
jgi:hypothetical protein